MRRDDNGNLITAVGPARPETVSKMHTFCRSISTRCTCAERGQVCDQIARAYDAGHSTRAEHARQEANRRGAHRRYMDED